MEDEPELVTRVRGGDHAAYAVIVRRYTPIALRTARLLGAGADTEDVVQEAFVRAYRAWGTLRPAAPLRPWLLAIVANQARNWHRGAQRRVDREGRVPVDVAVTEPAELVVELDRGTRLRHQLDQLPTDQREVLVCRYLLDLDEKETAAVLGLSRGTVKSRTFRALRRMRRELGPAEVEEVNGG